MDDISLIVIGALNTDIICDGLDQFPRPNDPVYGGKLVIGPGGKPGNIASMAGWLAQAGSVGMISKTVEDVHGLWQHPVAGLKKAGVNTEFVKVLKSTETQRQPSVALVAVDKQGNNMCFIMPGISQDFNEQDIEQATNLFESAGKNNGILALTLECPLPTTRHAIAKAKALGIRIALDPGGVVEGVDITDLIREQPYILKPNEYEAKIITGVTVTDFATAKLAAEKLKQLGAQNVLITHGEHGAYLFGDGDDTQLHIPIPEIQTSGSIDATGCGDQSMATLCVYLLAGKTLKEAAEAAIMAGTLQFHRLGIQPITKQELDAQL
ncbi:MAG TPA: PfkB family carbohydrate kinase [Candidatus Dormibacteraeota bacterium]|nr:PfkB family carbohydrate kinase [Candidatus Dormibacteraeota bacterium]